VRRGRVRVLVVDHEAFTAAVERVSSRSIAVLLARGGVRMLFRRRGTISEPEQDRPKRYRHCKSFSSLSARDGLTTCDGVGQRPLSASARPKE